MIPAVGQKYYIKDYGIVKIISMVKHKRGYFVKYIDQIKGQWSKAYWQCPWHIMKNRMIG